MKNDPRKRKNQLVIDQNAEKETDSYGSTKRGFIFQDLGSDLCIYTHSTFLGARVLY